MSITHDSARGAMFAQRRRGMSVSPGATVVRDAEGFG